MDFRNLYDVPTSHELHQARAEHNKRHLRTLLRKVCRLAILWTGGLLVLLAAITSIYLGSTVDIPPHERANDVRPQMIVLCLVAGFLTITSIYTLNHLRMAIGQYLHEKASPPKSEYDEAQEI
jgi:hypothetical protein